MPAPTVSKLNVFPNPVNDILHLSVSGTTGTILSLEGRVVRDDVNLHAGAIDVSTLAHGVYALMVTGADGEMHVVKFIKQ